MTAVITPFSDVAGWVLAGEGGLGTVRYVGVDGPMGAGKTTFAGRLGVALREAGARVAEIHTDDLLEGWTDTVGFWPRLREWLLEPLGRGVPGRYRRYDWIAGRFTEAWIPVPVPDVLLVEGVTSAQAETRTYRGLGVFVTADPELRLARGLARDGEALRPEWERWMLAEARHFAADRTEHHVDLIVDGAPAVPLDPEREFLRLPSPV